VKHLLLKNVKVRYVRDGKDTKLTS